MPNPGIHPEKEPLKPEFFQPEKRPEEMEPMEISFDAEKATQETEDKFLDLDSLLKEYGVMVEEEQQKIKGKSGVDEEEEVLELIEDDIEVLEKGIAGAKAEFLDKVSEALGGNEGGWYENRETGEKYYLKFYEKPDQARTEFIANRIYEKLEIPATHSELVEMNKRIAIANREVPGASPLSKDELIASEDAKKGYIADAYLGNWDVLDVISDNVMKSQDGRTYRIDNGSTFFTRSRGQEKPFPPDDIPELVTMVDPWYKSGEVFQYVTEKEKRQQAKDLINKLDDEFLKQVVDESGLGKKEADKILDALKGRRNFLKERFISSRQTEIFEQLAEISNEQFENEPLLPQIEIKGDREHIVDQQIDFVRQKDKTAVYFKIDKNLIADIRSKINEASAGLPVQPLDSLDFENSLGQKVEIRGGKIGGVVIGNEGNSVKLREGVKINITYKGPEAINGQVRVDIDKDLADQADEIMDEVAEFFAKSGVEDLWGEPDEKTELQQSRALWETQHKRKLTQEARENIELQEVYPGYVTAVEKGKHKEYADKYGVKALMMKIDDENLSKIMGSSGLMSSAERYKRGVLITGPSSDKDFYTGGADYVFTRAINQNALDTDRSFDEFFPYFDSATLIIDPEQLDRLDWFAYHTDNCGSTQPDIYDKRPSAEEFFDKEKTHFYDGNEVMFKRGIAREAIQAIVVNNGTHKDKLVEQLRNHGIKEINGKPVEEFVKVAMKFSQYFEK